VTAVINVQTEVDHLHRSIDWPLMLATYERYGIKAVHYPIHDFNSVDLESKLKGGALILKELIDGGH
jgi:protein-tyrosine phosphatase